MKANKFLTVSFIAILCLISIGCDPAIDVADAIIQQRPVALSDSRFNGTFSYFDQWEDSWGIEETYEYTSLDFEGTNKVFYYTEYYSYFNSTGWTYSGDYIGDHYAWYLEFQVQNGFYRTKLWDNDYSDWGDWEPYSFSSDGNTLTLENWYNIPGNDLVLTK
jgi:hypothetical protein